MVDAIASHEEAVRAHNVKCRSLEDQVASLRVDKVRLDTLMTLVQHHSNHPQDYASELLRDARGEREQLRAALNSENQRIQAALEELRSRATYLEHDNVSRA